MGNWIPGDPTLVAQILRISSAYSPPPPDGFVSPMTWGIEADVVERFGGAGVRSEQISFARDAYVFGNSGREPSELLARSCTGNELGPPLLLVPVRMRPLANARRPRARAPRMGAW